MFLSTIYIRHTAIRRSTEIYLDALITITTTEMIMNPRIVLRHAKFYMTSSSKNQSFRPHRMLMEYIYSKKYETERK